MGPHGWYLISAYSVVGVFLTVQWLLPWRRFRKYWRQNQDKVNE